MVSHEADGSRYSDNCPECVSPSTERLATLIQPNGVLVDYRCTVCGHRWFTTWANEARP